MNIHGTCSEIITLLLLIIFEFKSVYWGVGRFLQCRINMIIINSLNTFENTNTP